MRSPHTSTYQGKRVRVVLRDGTVFVDRFLQHKSKRLEFENHLVNTVNLKSFAIFKQQDPGKLRRAGRPKGNG